MASVKEGYANDPYFATKRHTKRLTLRQGIWYKGKRIAIPNIRGIKECILNEVHDSPLSGHVGVNRTFESAKLTYW